MFNVILSSSTHGAGPSYININGRALQRHNPLVYLSPYTDYITVNRRACTVLLCNYNTHRACRVRYYKHVYKLFVPGLLAYTGVACEYYYAAVTITRPDRGARGICTGTRRVHEYASFRNDSTTPKAFPGRSNDKSIYLQRNGTVVIAFSLTRTSDYDSTIT